VSARPTRKNAHRSLERRPAARACVFGVLGVLGVLVSLQCSGRDATPPSQSEVALQPGARPAWLGPLEQAHGLADQANTPALREQALAAFERALAQLPPAQTGLTAGQLFVRQDALARCAELELDQGRPVRAIERADRALALSLATSMPVATLQTIRGRAFEALGETEAAVSAYHTALVINQALMERALDSQQSEAK
jgi:tetratricopeptide (TPR) repeat protein